jgi:hypothetical protein
MTPSAGKACSRSGRPRRGVFTSVPDLTQAIITDQRMTQITQLEAMRSAPQFPTHVAHRQSG